jgi:hypothetical protein
MTKKYLNASLFFPFTFFFSFIFCLSILIDLAFVKNNLLLTVNIVKKLLVLLP